MKEWRREADGSQDIIQKIEKNYTFTKLTNDFVCKVLQNDRFKVSIEPVGTVCLGMREKHGNESYTIVLKSDNKIYRLLNDFEITDMKGRVVPELTNAWREGMIKRGLPVVDKKNHLDINSYLKALYAFEFTKLQKDIAALDTIAAERMEATREVSDEPELL